MVVANEDVILAVVVNIGKSVDIVGHARVTTLSCDEIKMKRGVLNHAYQQ